MHPEYGKSLSITEGLELLGVGGPVEGKKLEVIAESGEVSRE